MVNTCRKMPEHRGRHDGETGGPRRSRSVFRRHVGLLPTAASAAPDGGGEALRKRRDGFAAFRCSLGLVGDRRIRVVIN